MIIINGHNFNKLLLDIFQRLSMIKGAQVHWYYEEDDEDMQDVGAEFAEMVKVPFELIAY